MWMCDLYAMMNKFSSEDQSRRRKRPRLRVGIPAHLQTLNGPLEVKLLDISQSGARIEIPSTERPHSAVLQWLEYEAYGDIVWERSGLLGMKFDPPLPADQILRTRELAPSVGANLTASERSAKAFAEGDSRWR